MTKAKEPKAPRIPIAQDPDRLGAWADRLLKRMDGQRLCQRFEHDPKSDQTVQFWLEPSGKRARPDAAQELIRKGRVRPLADGLFADAPSQTFELASA